jgi:hypothetical protein
MSQENVRLVERAIAAINARDIVHVGRYGELVQMLPLIGEQANIKLLST